MNRLQNQYWSEDRSLNGCISSNLEVDQTATPQLPVYYIVVRTRSKDENGPHIGERFGVSSVLILALNLVAWL